MVQHFGPWLGPFLDAVEDVTHPFMTKIIGTIQASHQLGEDAFLLLGRLYNKTASPLSCWCDLRSGVHSNFSGNHYSSITKLSGSSTSRPNIVSFGEKPVDSCTEERYAIISKGTHVGTDPNPSGSHRQIWKAWSRASHSIVQLYHWTAGIKVWLSQGHRESWSAFPWFCPWRCSTSRSYTCRCQRSLSTLQFALLGSWSSLLTTSMPCGLFAC